jgi:hypothetical protein
MVYATYIYPRCEPWCWNIDLQNYVKHSWGFDVGQYSITMEHLGFSYSCVFLPKKHHMLEAKMKRSQSGPHEIATQLTDN